MKTTLLALALGLIAFAQPASALVITVDTNTSDTFAFDIVWGPTYIPQPGDIDTQFGIRADGGNGGGVSGGQAFDGNTLVGGNVETPTTLYPGGLWVAGFELDFKTNPDGSVDRHFASVNNFEGQEITAATSVTPIADGYGAHLVYDFSHIDQDLADYIAAHQPPSGSDTGEPVPDAGASAGFLALSLGALWCAPRRASCPRPVLVARWGGRRVALLDLPAPF